MYKVFQWACTIIKTEKKMISQHCLLSVVQDFRQYALCLGQHRHSSLCPALEILNLHFHLLLIDLHLHFHLVLMFHAPHHTCSTSVRLNFKNITAINSITCIYYVNYPLCLN